MANRQIINWIKNQESHGYSPQQIYTFLIRQGYNQNDVNGALNLTSRKQTPQQGVLPPKWAPFLPLLLIGMAIAALVWGGIFWFASQDNKTGSEILTDTQGNKAGKINAQIEADIEVASDCGGMDCFKEKFSRCKPAAVTLKLMDNLIYHYEIIGLKDGFCEVKSKFTANPNPEWVGKEMTCKYDNAKDFQTAVKDMDKCQGALYDLMTGKTQSLSSYTLELDVRIPKDNYNVGESLEGSKYYLKYKGEPFKGMILYSQSTEGLIKKSYSAARGIIQTGDFDNPKTLSGLKVSMYSMNPDGAPNPFDCDGNYVYSISVYDCAGIDNALGTGDCGKGGSPPAIESKDIAARVSPLKTASRRISVVCPDDTDCCTNWAYRCSSDRDCMKEYSCQEKKCVPL